VPYFKPGKELKELINREEETAPSSNGGVEPLPGVATQA